MFWLAVLCTWPTAPAMVSNTILISVMPVPFRSAVDAAATPWLTPPTTWLRSASTDSYGFATTLVLSACCHCRPHSGQPLDDELWQLIRNHASR